MGIDEKLVAKTLKFKYAGRKIRDKKDKWNNILTSWSPHRGKRKRGKPCTRWVDVGRVEETSWSRLTNKSERQIELERSG